MRDTWEQVKHIVDWFWVIFLGIMGNIGLHWDMYIAKATAFMAFILLAHKIKRAFFPSKGAPPQKDDYSL